MKKLVFIFLIGIYSISINAQSCDSLRIILNAFHENANVSWHSLEIDSVNNRQISSSTNQLWDPLTQSFLPGTTEYFQWDTIGNQILQYKGTTRVMFEYDTTGRLIILDSASFDGTTWNTFSRLEYYFTVTDLDSTQLHFGFVNSIYMLDEQITWIYDSLSRLIQEKTEGYTNNIWQITKDVHTTYVAVLPGVVRTDSVFMNGTSGIYLNAVFAYNYNSPDSIAYTCYEYVFNPMFPSYSFQSWNKCGYTMWDRSFPSDHEGFWEYANFDSLCRVTHFESGEAALSYGRRTDCKEYYYVDCNSMIGLMTSNTNKICKGDSVLLSVNVYGGVPPYKYQWTSGGGISNDSVSHPLVFPTNTSSYICTVTDSNLISWTDTISIHVDPFVPANMYLLSIDNIGPCSSAEIATSPVIGTSFYWYLDGASLSNHDSILPIIYNGVYTLHLYSGVCPLQTDTLVMTQLTHPSPIVSFTEGCNQLFAHSNGPSTFEWYLHLDTIPFYSGDTLNITSSNNYNLIATDSLGCSSEKIWRSFELFQITPNFTQACNVSCLGWASVSGPFYYQPFSYLWTNGDTTSFTDSLCRGIIGVTVTTRLGCQLLAVDSCSSVSVPEILQPDQNLIEIYPNPSSSIITVDLNEAHLNFPLKLKVNDLLGRVVKEQIINESIFQFEVGNLTSGVYLISIFSNKEKITNRKLVIE